MGIRSDIDQGNARQKNGQQMLSVFMGRYEWPSS